MKQYSKEFLRELYETMMRIRLCEESFVEPILSGEVRGPVHLSTGEEAIVAGVLAHLQDEDALALDHRSTPPLVNHGVDLFLILRELLGCEDGLCGGKGGHMHLFDKATNCGCSSVIGACLPLSLGPALAAKMRGKDSVSVAFFGEGAVNNGVFHESLNMSAIFKLPIIFICENNLYAVSTDVRNASAGDSISNKACAYNIPGSTIDGMDVEDVYKSVKNSVERARSGKGPSLIEASTYRFYGHHLQDAQVYRDKKELNLYKKTKDPVANYKRKLIKEKVLNSKIINEIEKEIEGEIEEALHFAEESPEPELEEYLEEIKTL